MILYRKQMKNNKVDLEGAVAMATRKDPSHAEAARELTIPCLDVTGKCPSTFFFMQICYFIVCILLRR